MSICFISPYISFPVVSCRSSPAVVRVNQSPPPPTLLPPLPRIQPEPASISHSPNPTLPSPSLSCALQCLHFQSCSGCSHEYNLHHPGVLDEAADFFKTVGVSDFKFDSCRLWGWRCRAKLAVRGSSDNPLIGLYQEGTHDIVDIPHCKAHHPSINAAVEQLRKGITQLNVEPYNEDLGTGELRYVQMAVTTYNTSLPFSERYKHGKVQVTLVWNSRSENSPSFQKLDALANFLWRTGGPRCSLHLIHSVWVNFQTSSSNVIFGNRWRHLLGERDFWEHIGGIDVSLAPSSFGQANTRAFDSLLNKLQKYVPLGASVTDLYGGAGVIGLSLAATRSCRSVKCVEINKEAKISFEKTISRLPEYIDSNISWHHADAAVEPLLWLVGSDVLVVDPPRKGLDPSLIAVLKSISSAEKKVMTTQNFSLKPKEERRPWVLRAKEASVSVQSKSTFSDDHFLPHTLIYISCGWSSFKEDCKSLLSSRAWHLDKAHGFNFFPGTNSMEILAVFKRGRRMSAKKKKSGKKKKKNLS